MELAPAVPEKGTELLLKQLEELIAQIQIWDRFTAHLRRTARADTRWDPPQALLSAGEKTISALTSILGGIATIS